MDRLTEQVLEWLRTGRVGTSSETMAWRVMGNRARCEDHPYDPDDFRRCLLFLEAVPLARKRLDKLRPVSKTWNGLVDRWDELEALFLEECGSLDPPHGTKAPRLYKLMREIRQGEITPGYEVVLQFGE